MDLSNLKPNEGAVSERSRVGRGHASGNGKTAGRGTQGTEGSFRRFYKTWIRRRSDAFIQKTS